MKKQILLLLMGLIMLIGVGCTTQEEVVVSEDKAEEKNNVESKVSNEKTSEKAEIEEVGSKKEKAKYMGPDFILENLRVGMSTDEVHKVFGGPRYSSFSELDGTYFYVYYYAKPNEEYDFEPPTPDEVDVDGLLSGNLEFQLFINWTGASNTDTVYSFNFYTKENEYYMSPDGELLIRENNW